uniref:Transmembrane protein 182 n=1 Tax=Electrophorus electricus TaxID=8005 RepID=A0A4W4DM54_ELEEL
MKTGVAALAAGLVGGLGVLCFLLAFSTDYWLLASNKCVGLRKESSSMVGIKEQANSTEVMETNQPQSKTCVRGYLFPLPVAVGRVPHHIYDATVVFRGFWTMLTVLAIVASITGGFLLVCAVPFISPKLYKVGGAFLIIVDNTQEKLNLHYGQIQNISE